MRRPPPRSTLFPYTTLFRSARFLGIPVGRHAARSGLHLFVLRAAGIAAGTWGRASSFAGQFVSLAVGVVPHLLRVDPKRTRLTPRHHILPPSAYPFKNKHIY